jgi:hypothetical protein
MITYTPYTYLIGWSKLNKWYYGVRYAEKYSNSCLYKTGCHPDDLWKTYFTSSKVVKKYRSEYGEPDIVKVRRIFTSKTKAILWEEKVLQRLHVLESDKWLNNNVAGGIVLTEEGRRNISIASKAKRGRVKLTEEQRAKLRGPHTDERKAITSKSLIGLRWWNNGLIQLKSKTDPGSGFKIGRLPLSEEHKKKIKENSAQRGKKPHNYGKTHSIEACNKMKETRKGNMWWTDGINETLSSIQPGPDWKKGRSFRNVNQ